MPIEITKYKCSYCNKREFKTKSSCVRHEKRCFWNPIMRACATCGNCEPYHAEHDVYIGDGNVTQHESCLTSYWCDEYNRNLITDGVNPYDNYKSNCKQWKERTEL